MRPSPRRHPVAVLRTLLHITQGDLAGMTGYARPTIQAVELLKIPLSQEMATRVSKATGVSVGWLINGDPLAPPVGTDGKPYSPESFNHAPMEATQQSPRVRNGGPAFPLQSIGPDFTPGYAGMTLRDYFAAAALQGLLAGFPDGEDIDGHNLELITGSAWAYADDMLKRRDQ